MTKKFIIIATVILLIAIGIGIGVAIYSNDRYTVTFDLVGGTMDVNKTTVKYGAAYQLPFPTKDDSIFEGWFYNGEFVESAGAKWMFKEDITLKAGWVIKDEYSFVYEKVDGGYILTEYKGPAKEYIIIPLTYKNEPIVEIKDGIFNRINGQSVDIEKKISIICLPKGSKYNTSKLGFDDYVTFSEYSLIGDDNFLYCDNGEYLTAVCYRGDFKKNVFVKGEYQGKQIEAVGEKCFYGATNKVNHNSMTSFTRVMLHENVKQVGKDAFAKCGGMGVSLYKTKGESDFVEIVNLSILFTWGKSATIDSGNEQLLDVISRIRPAFGWSIYSNASYYVLLDANGGTVETSELYLKSKDKYSLPTPIREGYIFEGWYYGDVLIEQNGEWRHYKHIELIAKWTEN